MSQSTVYIISDGTGETASSMARAALIQFKQKDLNIIKAKNIRTESQVEALLTEVSAQNGFIIHTVASPALRKKIAESTNERNIQSVDLLGPLLEELHVFLGVDSEAVGQPGILRRVDKAYYKRIEAIEFTVKHDDGKTFNRLTEADIVLVGISRTSKTPLSIFLSHKGWKVANIPLVLNTDLPEELFKVDQRKIVGLTISEENLYKIRRKRLEKFGQDPGSEYASKSHIQKELDFAKNIFSKNRKWPVFDVTDRALEETAGEIIRIVASRLNLPYDLLL